MSKIAFIAPDKYLYLRGKEVIRELGLEYEIDMYLSRLSKAVGLARRLQNQDTDVIISRGGTAQLIIEANVKIPVVEISITGQELAQLFQETKRITGLPHPKVLISVFQNLLNDVEVLADILEIDLSIYPLTCMEDIPRGPAEIVRLKHNSVDIVMGGKRTIMLAAKCGFKTLLIRSGRIAIQAAVLEAKKIALARKLEKEHAEEFKTLVEYSSEGIISVNRDKVVKIFNRNAERLLNRTAGEVLGQKVDTMLDFIDIDACLQEGREFVGQNVRFGSNWLTFNVVPIVIEKVVTGAIITLQDITRIQKIEARIRNDVLAKKFVAKYRFDNIQGVSPKIVEVKRIAREMAAVDAAVLISGESGTGKELFAQSIHNASKRRDGPFVAVNCAALSPSLLESELFGYVEGAFTGANKKGKPGLFEMAHRGTIFLDEISEMDKYGQSRLLRVLQEKQVMRLGDDKNIPVDVRVIAASNQDLIELTKEHLFRQDLFYRLKVLTLELPPLRQRQQDIKKLARHFLDHFNGLYAKQVQMDEPVYHSLAQYNWPGNVRELMHFIERLVVIAKETFVTADVMRQYWPDKSNVGKLEPLAFKEDASFLFSERERIAAALSQAGGSIVKAAGLLEIDRSTLYRKMKKYGIHKT